MLLHKTSLTSFKKLNRVIPTKTNCHNFPTLRVDGVFTGPHRLILFEFTNEASFVFHSSLIGSPHSRNNGLRIKNISCLYGELAHVNEGNLRVLVKNTGF